MWVEIKQLHVCQVIVWHLATERPSLYSFPHKQIHFLSVPHDAIQQTGNNMPLFSPSVILLSAISCFAVCFLCLSAPCISNHQTTYYNEPSISGRKVFFFPLLVKVISPPTVHFYPTSFDAVTAHLNSVKMRCFKANGGGVAGSHCCTCDVCLKWLYRDTSEADLHKHPPPIFC